MYQPVVQYAVAFELDKAANKNEIVGTPLAPSVCLLAWCFKAHGAYQNIMSSKENPGKMFLTTEIYSASSWALIKGLLRNIL